MPALRFHVLAQMEQTKSYARMLTLNLALIRGYKNKDTERAILPQASGDLNGSVGDFVEKVVEEPSNHRSSFLRDFREWKLELHDIWKTLLGSWPPQKAVCIWSRRMVRDLILGIDMNQMPRWRLWLSD
ncbi:hypothetical protein Tco_1296326 [Tanacetum coccineum]